MCQDMPRTQDFAPFTPELLEAFSGLQTPDSGLKGAKICNLAISWQINQLF
jgi:hypothetical protein